MGEMPVTQDCENVLDQGELFDSNIDFRMFGYFSNYKPGGGQKVRIDTSCLLFIQNSYRLI